MTQDQDSKTNPTIGRRGFLKGISASFALAATACGNDEKKDPEAKAVGTEKGEDSKPKAGGADAPLNNITKNHRLRFSLTEMPHFADRSYKGLLTIPLGHISARKYTNGGWRAGWDIEKRNYKGKDCYEADSKSARVFFKHSKDGYDRIIVNMKAVKSSNKVTFYVNNEAISTVDIDGSWKNYTVKVPSKHRNNGENQLMMRFKHDTTKDGRKQCAHVSAVYVVPKGMDIAKAPKGPATQNVELKGSSLPSLIASSPQTFTYRLQIPENSPKIALAIGAKKGGASFTVTAKSDTKSKKTLLNETIDDSKAGAWHPHTLSLKAFAGEVIELDLTTDGSFDGGQLAAWGEPGLYTPPFKDSSKAAKDPKKPAKNVVVYLIDTLRYDKFKFYNPKSRVKTPNINAFAKDATIFDAAYDNENWTKPSTASILTGLYPDTHGAKEDSSKVSNKATLMSEHFKKNGFKTGAFLSNGYVSDVFGFKQGWDHYRNYIREKTKTDADRVVEDGLKWISENKDSGRFFAYLHTIDPHVPYAPPEKYRKMYWNRAYNGPIKPNATGDQLAQIKTNKMSITREDKKYLEALYDGETTFNDFAFGELVKGLKEQGLYDNTVIVIIADHGEEFWDHGKVGHGHSLYEEMIHSPLVVRYPNKAHAGRRIPHVTSMVDLAPSLFDITGIPKHDNLEGTSWADTLDGTGNPNPRIAVSDFLFRKKSVRVGRYKWITMGRGGDLYDLKEDPKEKRDVIDKHGIGRAFVRANFGIFKGSEDSTEWWKFNGQSRKSNKADLKADEADIDSEMRKQLEELGYVEGAAAPSSKKKKKND